MSKQPKDTPWCCPTTLESFEKHDQGDTTRREVGGVGEPKIRVVNSLPKKEYLGKEVVKSGRGRLRNA